MTARSAQPSLVLNAANDRCGDHIRRSISTHDGAARSVFADLQYRSQIELYCIYCALSNPFFQKKLLRELFRVSNKSPVPDGGAVFLHTGDYPSDIGQRAQQNE